MRPHPALASLLALAACGGDSGGSGLWGGTPGVSSQPETTGSSDPDSSSGPAVDASTSSTGAGSTTDTMLWDMGSPDFGTQHSGCAGKIDFLFVVSTENVMKNDQDLLLAGFPGLMQAIEYEFAAYDIHILSANTNRQLDLHDCSVCTDSCDPQGTPPFCGAQFNACDKKVGAAVTFPTGPHASNRRCELESGLRYITTGQHDLAEAFTCIAQVGVGGAGITAEAMVTAIQPLINDPTDEDACNRGFLRDDALLVVTIIQDTYDVDSVGGVDDWIAALRKAKHGDDDAFAVLVLTTDVDVGYDKLCWPDLFNKTKNRLRLLAEGVKHGFVGSICEDSFVPFFEERVADIAELCDAFVAPG